MSLKPWTISLYHILFYVYACINPQYLNDSPDTIKSITESSIMKVLRAWTGVSVFFVNNKQKNHCSALLIAKELILVLVTKSLAKNILSFKELRELPLNLDPAKFDQGSGIENTLKLNSGFMAQVM